MIVSVEHLRGLSERILVRKGLDETEAHIVTDILLEAELRGRPTHGLIRLPGVAERSSREKRRPLRIAKDGPAYALIDGQENLGYIVAHRCARVALEKAGGSGVGVVGGFNTGHSGMLGYYASMIADSGMVGLVMCNAFPRIVPTGGTKPVLGTNPIAAGFPAGKGQVLVDLSTAAITNGQILMALKEGKRIPEGCGLGPDGRGTTDPEAVRDGGVFPFGGHKGYALALMVQIFSGVLVNAAAVPGPGKNYGIFVLAISPSIFVDPAWFRAGVDELIQRLKSAGPGEDVGEILIPGERAFRERETRLREGIEVDEALMEELNGLIKE